MREFLQLVTVHLHVWSFPCCFPNKWLSPSPPSWWTCLIKLCMMCWYNKQRVFLKAIDPQAPQSSNLEANLMRSSNVENLEANLMILKIIWFYWFRKIEMKITSICRINGFICRANFPCIHTFLIAFVIYLYNI